MIKHRKNKKPWPTKDAMVQVYEKNLWGGNQSEFYSGDGSHYPALVAPYLAVVSKFFTSFKASPVVCDLGCGDFNIGKELVKYTKKYSAVDIVPRLIEHHKNNFSAENLEFHCLNIATDNVPPGDCAILRQVLQHLSNAEIAKVAEKLNYYKYVILTEHVPQGDFTPNIDIISGQGIRLKKNSGVNLLAAPFNFKVKEERHLVSLVPENKKGVIVTMLYQVF
ncbi:class I SAM-dependent methyltransferase [Salegentibacter echinorum]|nr:class I SAM-dependent methyltransferase [Salegentibacter echinorum]